MNLLKDILYGVNLISVSGTTNLDIKKIEFDSRKVSYGDLFVAIPGYNDDGQKYIIDAIKSGAKAVISEANLEKLEYDITIVHVKKSREALAILASNFYNNPSKELKLIGITGTNGKTTTK